MGWVENLSHAKTTAELAKGQLEQGEDYRVVQAVALTSIALSLSCIAGDRIGEELGKIRGCLDDIYIAIQDLG